MEKYTIQKKRLASPAATIILNATAIFSPVRKGRPQLLPLIHTWLAFAPFRKYLYYANRLHSYIYIFILTNKQD